MINFSNEIIDEQTFKNTNSQANTSLCFLYASNSGVLQDLSEVKKPKIRSQVFQDVCWNVAGLSVKPYYCCWLYLLEVGARLVLNHWQMTYLIFESILIVMSLND